MYRAGVEHYTSIERTTEQIPLRNLAALYLYNMKIKYLYIESHSVLYVLYNLDKNNISSIFINHTKFALKYLNHINNGNVFNVMNIVNNQLGYTAKPMNNPAVL